MRYAIVSDVHANLQAWKAVLLDIRSQKIDRIICLGDCVGYGPNPAEVLQSIHANIDFIVLGNHDAAVCGKMNHSLFNPLARQCVEWTRSQLNSNAVQFLQSLPLSLAGPDFRCTHGDFTRPAAYNYIFEPEDASASWQSVAEPLLFVGHTHEPGLFTLDCSQAINRAAPGELSLEKNIRYIVNPGSVGQPRDCEARASYCILDRSRNTILWRRIPFDLDAYKTALESTGMPLASSPFLRFDPRTGIQPLRESIDFSPAPNADLAVHNTVAVQDVALLRRNISKWRLVTSLLLLLILTTLVTAGALYFRYTRTATVIPDPIGRDIHADAIPSRNMSHRDQTPIPLDNNILILPSHAIPPGQPLPGWEIRVGNRYSQSAAIQMQTGTPTIAIQSRSNAHDIELRSAPIVVAPDQRFRLYAEIRTNSDFKGTVEWLVTQAGAPGTDVHTFLKENPRPRKAGPPATLFTSKVFPDRTKGLPPGVTRMQVALRCRFTGTLYACNLGLCRLDNPRPD